MGKEKVTRKAEIDPSLMSKKYKTSPVASNQAKLGKEDEYNENEIEANKLFGYGDTNFEDCQITLLDGKTYIMSPFILKDFREVLALVKKLINPNPEDDIVRIMVKIIWYSLKRNHPDITVEYLEEVIDERISRKMFEVISHYLGFDELVNKKKA